MTSYGSLNPPLSMKIIWGLLLAAIAGVLLYAGGLDALQTASLISALPFTILMLLMIVSMVMMLKNEPLSIRKVVLRRYRRLEEAANKQKDKANGEKSK